MLNPHLHGIVLDGVFALGENATPVFHPLPSLDIEDVADLLQVIRVRVLGMLERRGVIEDRAELTLLDDGLAEREPALAQLAAAAVSGLAPAGPEQRQRPPIALRGQVGVEVAAPLCVAELGFSLHAATEAGADDERGREALVRYALRPPLAQERLSLLDSGLVRIELRRPFRDGTVAADLDPLSLLCRLAAAVQPPRSHTVRYSGVLGAASKLRALVVPVPPANLVSVDTALRGGAESLVDTRDGGLREACSHPGGRTGVSGRTTPVAWTANSANAQAARRV